MTTGDNLVRYEERVDGPASITVDLDHRGDRPISRYLTGKFCEHLGSNIYNGMDAQILRNHTFAAYAFRSGNNHPDGGAMFHGDPSAIRKAVEHHATRLGLGSNETERMVTDYEGGLAFWWTAVAPVVVSPDVGPAGQRAQRVEVKKHGGLAQWIYLPLHRVRIYHVELTVRGSVQDGKSISVAILGANGVEQASCGVGVPGNEWSQLRGTLELPECDPDDLYRFVIRLEGETNIVIARASLWPDDHVHGADPDVIEHLKDSNLAILRWPGGNFVSSYRWEDGIGPLDTRPTRTNPAWGGVEPNTFGTDEFMAFCRAVGCEPMICINAGTGTSEEAARWLEYCNGDADTPMGRLRAQNGHPEPHNVTHWEIGNEIYGKWQSNWTTPTGHVDRYERFAKAMLAIDPSVKLYANGSQSLLNHEWNTALAPWLAQIPATLTDHALVGGDVGPDTDPLDIYRDFMSFPLAYEKRFRHYERIMAAAGVSEPRIAVTELQLFSNIKPPPASGDRLTGETHVNPATMAEALYATLFSYVAVRSAPLVEVVTHSATVNHGGGLRKERERVYANPCHYGRTMFGRLCGATPLAINITATYSNPPLVLKDLASLEDPLPTPEIDAVAALSEDGKHILISLVYRGTDGPREIEVKLARSKGQDPALEEIWAGATVTELSADVPWAKNDLESPEHIVPVSRSSEMSHDGITVKVAPFTVMLIEIVQ